MANEEKELTYSQAEFDEIYEIGKRDGYEEAVQEIELATGGDGEFKGSTFPGETVDVPAMKARIIERFEKDPLFWPDFVAPPKYDNAANGWNDPRLPDFRLIWATARECGYAVGLHGSMKRDCDLIAVPWVDNPQSAEVLIAALCKALNANEVGVRDPKPSGRIAVNLQVDGWVKLIDLSICASTIERLSAIEQERGIADQALVDRYRDPKTGKFNFPGDVAAIVRRLDAAEQERDALREALDGFVTFIGGYCGSLNTRGVSIELARLVRNGRATLDQTRTDASEAPDGH